MSPDFTPALQDCQAVLQADPDNSAVATLAQKLKDCVTHREILLLGKFIQATPSQIRPRLDYALGDYHRENGNLTLALEHLKRANEFENGAWRTQLALGLTYFVQGNYGQAQPWLQEATRLGPEAELAPAYEHVAEILARNHRQGESGFLPFFQRALDLYERTENSLAAARCRLRLSEAWRWWREPKDFLECAADLDAESAHKVLELGFRRHHQNAGVAFRFGQASLQIGQDRQACGCFMRVISLNDRRWHGPAYELTADTYRRLQLYPQEVPGFYQQALESYSTFDDSIATRRCRQKLQA